MTTENAEAYEEAARDEAMAQAARDSNGEAGKPFDDLIAEMCAAGEIDI